MADVLSQSQIDALLNSMQSGNSAPEEPVKKDEKSYRKYDFYSPKKFTKDKLRILSDVFDKYARVTSNQISSMLRLGCEAEVIAIEEQRYYEFSNVLSDDDVLVVVNVKLPDQIKNKPVLMYISPVLIVNFIDKMLGGDELSTEVEPSYVYTEIESALYESISEHFISGLQEVWANYITLACEFSQLAVNPGMFQAIGMDETVVIATISISVENIQGTLSVCLPGDLLNDVFLILDKRINREKEEGFNYVDSSDDIMYSIKNSQLQVKANMGNISLNISDLYNLHAGDVINLNKSKDSEVELQVAGIPWFMGRLGQHKKYMSILITDINKIETEEELLEEEYLEEEDLETEEQTIT